MDHNLEEVRRTVVAEVDILGGRSLEEGLVEDDLGRNLEGIGCMGLTCWIEGFCLWRGFFGVKVLEIVCDSELSER